MSAYRNVSGGSDSGSTGVVGASRRRRGPSALGVTDLRPRSVRQGGRLPARLYRVVDWGYVGFVLAVAATVFVLVYVAAGRMR